MKVCLLSMLLLVSGCSTDTYYKDSRTLVTVKKFAGIPYLEKEEHTSKRPAGSQSVPLQ
jgi:hypothetical protein